MSILFLLLFIFYLAGYRLLFMGLQYQAEVKMNETIEQRSYDAGKTVTLKIPLNLPYQIFSDDVRYVQGEFEHDGTFYSLIKQKIVNDTLYVVSVENELKSGIRAKKTLFEKITNEWPGASKNAHNIFISFSKDFLKNSGFAPGANHLSMVKYSFPVLTFDTLEGMSSTDTPPPKLAA